MRIEKMEQIILSPIPLIELEGIFQRIVQKALAESKKDSTQSESEDLLTRKEAANLLGVSLPTLHDYTTRSIIPAYRLGTRVRYRKGEILDCLRKVQTRNPIAA
jgi:excisionase family DNA binding protein